MRIYAGTVRKFEKVMSTCNDILVKKEGTFPWADADIAKMHKDFSIVCSDLEKMLQTAKQHVDGKRK